MNKNKYKKIINIQLMEPLVIENEYMYHERRVCKKTCLLFKTVGFGCYMTGSVACVAHTMFTPYCIMMVTMFASCCNSARYEYALYKKHGTWFHSIEEFNEWKNLQLPKLNDVFDAAEVIIKLFFFIASWPLKLIIYDDRNNAFSMCELNMTVLKIHATITVIVYSFALLLFIGMWCCFHDNAIWNQHASTSTTPNPSPVNATPAYAVYVNINENGSNAIECCICLNQKTEPWISTRCAHVFHRECLLTWNQINSTCPICRTSLA